jgi:hypothetical protein
LAATSLAANSTEISVVRLVMAVFVCSMVMACTALVEVSLCAASKQPSRAAYSGPQGGGSSSSSSELMLASMSLSSNALR